MSHYRCFSSFKVRGSCYENVVASKLKDLSFELTVTGKSGDKGIDLKGFWALQSEKIPIAVQCKCTSKPISVSVLREFEGALCTYQVINPIGIIAVTTRPTKSAIEYMMSSRLSLMYLCIDYYGNFFSCLMNPKFCQALPELTVLQPIAFDSKGSEPKFILMSDYEVSLVNDNMQEFYIKFHGPEGTPYSEGVWKIHVEIPDQYPYKSPSIGFVNKIFHPNVDEMSGSVCLDVINQTWSPMFGNHSLNNSRLDMINIFEVFLPQLLRYPNPTDPLNGEAAALLLREPSSYETKVKEYIKRFATKEAIEAAENQAEEGGDDDLEEDSFSDDDAPGMEL
ncbi:hypothetical protein ROZALSC1DRAFT_30628 [Rozella allomycis CSF55]|uniref:Ubiquitin-conjugating enzyme, E2 domain-containing protein n=1 Tax=Rozella allomycis (strain CSF55) TaxID=988480 RepID=A0A075AWI8_ROZAC|nr:Ubiquitin-conjugating enzyme, E2 domain-containing protein [Rozella allomycis CSF55]RKP17582.1 hypothetical protein ROZALSC1DRAFT_30628 [Rozella allomycis CSF55]|eukprot:EPZ32929.1 Ubiquitin-conjugating enzyme, E2 domain-containing protein [Rozella allomycis CSF55]